MMRLLLLCVLIGGAWLYLREQPAHTVPFATDAPLEVPVPAPVVVTTAPAPQPAPVADAASTIGTPVTSLTPPTPLPEQGPQPPKPVAKRASPIPTSPIPTSPIPQAIAILESPSAGLPQRETAAPRLPVTEILPDGTARAAGGSTEPAPPIARQLARRPAAAATTDAAPAKAIPDAIPSTAPAAPAALLRPSQADAFFKNAARILAETEIPK